MRNQGFTRDFDKMLNITILNSLGFFFLDFLIPYVASQELDATGSQMGVIFSVRTIGYFFVAPFIGTLADRVSSKLLIFIGSIGRGIAYFMMYYAIVVGDLNVMIFSNLLLGAMAGFFWIPLDILVSKKSLPTHRSQAFGKRTSALGKGTVIGAIIGFGFLTYINETQPLNRELMYLALVIYGLANFLAGLLFLRIDENLVIDDQEDEEGKKNTIGYHGYLKSLEKPFLFALVLILITFFLSSTNSSIYKPFILVYLTSNIESDPTLASLAYLPAGITAMLLAPKLGMIVDRMSYKFVIPIGITLGAITTLVLISTNSLLLFSILLVIDVTIATTTGLVVMNVISKISTKHRGKIFAMVSFFADLGAMIGPILGGILWDVFGQKSPFYFSIGVELMIIPIFLLAFKRITPFLEETLEQKLSADKVVVQTSE
jgi:MFS family permease